MRWSIIRLIWAREIRDQLRDRRTLFMIAVLPLVLYPLLGMSFFQITQFMREQPIRVLVVGAPESAELPPLVEEDHFAADLFRELPTVSPGDSIQAQLRGPGAGLIHVTQRGRGSYGKRDALDEARRELDEKRYDVVVYFPADFGERLAQLRKQLAASESGGEASPAKIPDI